MDIKKIIKSMNDEHNIDDMFKSEYNKLNNVDSKELLNYTNNDVDSNFDKKNKDDILKTTFRFNSKIRKILESIILMRASLASMDSKAYKKRKIETMNTLFNNLILEEYKRLQDILNKVNSQ